MHISPRWSKTAWMVASALALSSGLALSTGAVHAVDDSRSSTIEIQRHPVFLGTGLCMGEREPRTKYAIMLGCDNKNATLWDFRMGSSGYYTLVNSRTGRCADGNAGDSNVQMGACNGGRFQLWEIENKSGGKFKIWNVGIKEADNKLKCMHSAGEGLYFLRLFDCVESQDQYLKYMS